MAGSTIWTLAAEPMKDAAAMGWPQSLALASELELGRLVAGTRVHTGLLIAALLALALAALFRFTLLGFQIRASGANAPDDPTGRPK